MDRIQIYKTRIFECAKEIIKTGGKDALTLANIVQQCSISRRTFYEAYPSKEALIAELNQVLGVDLQIRQEREIIIEKAREGFARYGYSSIDMDTIAVAAGTNRTTLYKYFKTKEALFEYCVRHELEMIKQVAGGALANTETPLATLNEFITGYFDYIGNSYQSTLFSEIYSQIPHNEKLKEYVKSFKYYFIGLYQRLFRAGMSQGIFRADLDVEGTALVLQMILSGLTVFTEINPAMDINGKVRQRVLSLIQDAIRKT